MGSAGWVWLAAAVVLVVVVAGLVVVRRRALDRPAPPGTVEAAPMGTAGDAVLGTPNAREAADDTVDEVVEVSPPQTPAPQTPEPQTETAAFDLGLEDADAASPVTEAEPAPSLSGATDAGSTEPGAPAPPGFAVKGNLSSMLYHTPDSPYFARTRAQVWFNTEDAAREAGFTRWDEA